MTADSAWDVRPYLSVRNAPIQPVAPAFFCIPCRGHWLRWHACEDLQNMFFGCSIRPCETMSWIQWMGLTKTLGQPSVMSNVASKLTLNRSFANTSTDPDRSHAAETAQTAAGVSPCVLWSLTWPYCLPHETTPPDAPSPFSCASCMVCVSPCWSSVTEPSLACASDTLPLSLNFFWCSAHGLRTPACSFQRGVPDLVGLEKDMQFSWPMNDLHFSGMLTRGCFRFSKPTWDSHDVACCVRWSHICPWSFSTFPRDLCLLLSSFNCPVQLTWVASSTCSSFFGISLASHSALLPSSEACSHLCYAVQDTDVLRVSCCFGRHGVWASIAVDVYLAPSVDVAPVLSFPLQWLLDTLFRTSFQFPVVLMQSRSARWRLF